MFSESCSNTHVFNMLNIPVIAQDLQNMVVVASHDGILVSSKPGSSFMKPLTERINLRPMYEQRRWGTYRVLDYKQSGKPSSLIKRMVIEAGQTVKDRNKLAFRLTWIVISGKGILTINEQDSIQVLCDDFKI